MSVPVKDDKRLKNKRLGMAIGVTITNEAGDVVLETRTENGRLVDEIREDDD